MRSLTSRHVIPSTWREVGAVSSTRAPSKDSKNHHAATEPIKSLPHLWPLATDTRAFRGAKAARIASCSGSMSAARTSRTNATGRSA